MLGRCYKENEYIICPHTSVGVAYAYANPKPIPQVSRRSFGLEVFLITIAQILFRDNIRYGIKKVFKDIQYKKARDLCKTIL